MYADIVRCAGVWDLGQFLKKAKSTRKIRRSTPVHLVASGSFQVVVDSRRVIIRLWRFLKRCRGGVRLFGGT